MRSDAPHLKSSSGLYTLVFILVSMLFLFQRLEKYKKIKFSIEKIRKKTLSKYFILFYTFLAILFFSGTFNKNDNTSLVKKIQNIANIKNNIKALIDAKDSQYLNKDTKLVLENYKKLSKEDSCTQILTDDIAFTYFLKKPSCTQFYIPAQIINNYTEEKFIKQLKEASPNIILYRSLNNILTNYSNMPNAIKYIEKEYSFFKNYNNYIFYKKN